jgi:hypothetical protein
MDDPSFDIPYTEREDPRRKYPLNDREDPNVVKSSTERLLANLVIP